MAHAGPLCRVPAPSSDRAERDQNTASLGDPLQAWRALQAEGASLSVSRGTPALPELACLNSRLKSRSEPEGRCLVAVAHSADQPEIHRGRWVPEARLSFGRTTVLANVWPLLFP